MSVAQESFDATGHRTYFTVPADRPITVRDLFRHTSGLDYEGPKDENGEPAYKKLGFTGGDGWAPFDLAEAVRRLATVPLNHQPGTTFHYGLSIDVLGRLVEVLSGKPLDQFFEERIFRPLGMKDTAFFVPEEKWNRLAVLYTPKKGGGIEPSTSPAQENYKKKPTLLLGGAGSVSTLDDYARFVTMLLNGGELEGVRILGRKSVELMRSDHLGTLARAERHAGGRLRFRLDVCREFGPWQISQRRLGGRIQLGRCCGNQLLDRSQGTHDRRLPGQCAAQQRRRGRRPVQEAGVRGLGGLTSSRGR